jgi:putative colanic acid biosynthesis acetyltransferase WcaB
MIEFMGTKTLIEYITQDYYRNSSLKSKFILTWFRFCQYLYMKDTLLSRLLYGAQIGLYRITIDWIMGVDLHPSTKVGKGFSIYHGVGLVIAKNCTIGDECTVRHGVTIGRKIEKNLSRSKDPIIGNNVEFGAHSIIIGHIVIGDNCRIGAGTVVTKSLPINTTVVPQNFRVLEPKSHESKIGNHVD